MFKVYSSGIYLHPYIYEKFLNCNIKIALLKCKSYVLCQKLISFVCGRDKKLKK